MKLKAKYLKTPGGKCSDNQRVQQNKLEQNDKNRLEYEKNYKNLNEQIAISQNELSGQRKYGKKVKDLEKLKQRLNKT